MMKKGRGNRFKGEWKEWLKGGLLIGAAGWLCFRSWLVCLAGMVLLPFFVRAREKQMDRTRQYQLWREFRNVTTILYSSTAAGGTMEKAFRDAARDMAASARNYPLLLPEFQRLCHQLDSNRSMEEALTELAMRCRDEDIASFVEILCIARKSGGSLSEIIRQLTDTMNMRMEVNTEIETILAGKRGEWKVMMIVPPAILLYMNLCSASYMNILYETLAGRAVMAAALAIYGIAAVAGQRILDIKV